MMNNIISSDGYALHLTPAEYALFKVDEQKLFIKYYKIQRKKRGIWATNQNKFVANYSDLKPWDSKFMEALLR
jgi:hypothetical protein